MKKPLGVGGEGVGGEDRFHGKDWELERRGDRRRNVLHLADVTEGSIIYVLHRPLSLLHPIEGGRPSKHLFCLACKNIYYSQKP